MSNKPLHGRRVRSAANKFLTMMLGDELYGVPLLKVQEIIGIQEVTPVPRAPAEVRGVINLRGKVIPVIDLRIRFGMGSVEATKRTCIVVVQVAGQPVSDPGTAGGTSALILGCIVDHVSEVQDIPPEQIEPPPAFGTAVDTSFISGIGKLGKKVAMLLDIDRALGPSTTGLSF